MIVSENQIKESETFFVATSRPRKWNWVKIKLLLPRIL